MVGPGASVSAPRAVGGSLVLLTLLSFAFGCDPGATARFPVGLSFEVTDDDLRLPEELREEGPDGPIVSSVPCGPMGMCTADAPVSCEAGICDPAPQTIAVPLGDVISLDDEIGVFRLFSEVDTIEILAVEYEVQRDTLALPVDEVEIHWGPAGAIDVDPAMGVTLLATVPYRDGAEGEATLDEAGAAAFSAHFESVSRRVRFFLKTQADMHPGGPYPEGTLSVAVRAQMQIHGNLL